MRINIKFWGELFFLFLALVTVVVTALFIAQAISDNPELQATVASWGYLGVVLLGIVAGLNVIVPLPAGSFAPAFVAAGMWMPFIIIALTIGTLIADYIGYAFGRWSRTGISEKYPKLLVRYESLITKHHIWLLPVIFLYAAFVPFPSEAIILPLAVLGINFRQMFLPLLLGNLLYQTLLSYGAQNLFLWWF
ncbi:MAG: hypothetical protein KBD44_00765 [Candidatus Pacebacteria bacterium]|jgi:membrane protein DedA with SNARE-associated domain|nr:hypothetical protein [Candidatus Paceibacterota bacterium]